MGAPVFFPTRNVRDIHPRTHDMFKSRAQAIQRGLDVLQGLRRLSVSIADANNLTVSTKCRGSCYVNAIADAHRARIANYRLPLCTRRDSLPFGHAVFTPILVGDELSVAIRPPIAEELPGVANFANQIQVQIGN